MSNKKMTMEETIELLEKEKAYMLSHGGDRQAEALDIGIKAVELFKSGFLKDCEYCMVKQEQVFDKIRTEVLELIDDLDVANEICDIFDKYKKREVEE